MAFFTVRSKLSSLIVKKPTLSPKACVFLALSRSFSTIPFLPTLERLPYTGKICLASPQNNLPHEDFMEFLNERSGCEFLPSSDKRVMEVESIARKLIDAMSEGLMLDKPYKINGNVYEPPRRKIWEQRTLIWKPVTEHLNGREWEFHVAEALPRETYLFTARVGRKLTHYLKDLPEGSFLSSAGIGTGSIVVLSALLKGNVPQDVLDAVIATVIAYEQKIEGLDKATYIVVVHNRHSTVASASFGAMTASVLYGVMGLILYPVMVYFGVWFVIYRRWRIIDEAVQIGVILMASAGYDPVVAPLVYEHIFDGNGVAKFSIKSDVMKKAGEIYEEVKSGKRVRKFV